MKKVVVVEDWSKMGCEMRFVGMEEGLRMGRGREGLWVCCYMVSRM